MHTRHTSIDQQPAEEHSPGVSAEPSLAFHLSFRLGLVDGHFVHRFRWFLLVFWIAVLGASMPFSARLPSLLSGGGFQVRSSETAQVNRELIEKLHMPPSTLTVILPCFDGSPPTPTISAMDEARIPILPAVMSP